MNRFATYVGSLCFCFPTFAVFLWHISDSFDYRVLLGCLAAVAAEHYILLSSTQGQRYQGLRDLNKWLSEFPDVDLIKRSVTDYNLDGEVNELLRRGFGLGRSQKLGMSIELFQVVCPRPPLPSAVKAFAFGNTCVIFVRDPPGDLTDYGRFRIHHELGHAFPVSPAFSTLEYSSLPSLPLFGFVAFALTESWLVTILAFSGYTISRLFFFHGGGSYKMAELSADQFAAYFLREAINLDRVADLMRRWEKDNPLTNQRVARLKAFVAGDIKCESPELPEIPLSATIVPYCAVALLGTIWNTELLSMVIASMFGVAVAHRILARYRARLINPLESQTMMQIVFRQYHFRKLVSDTKDA